MDGSKKRLIPELRTSNANRLYYLNQHFIGEPKELIGECLYLEPDILCCISK